jgi:farnesyl diphosphate synthase
MDRFRHQLELDASAVETRLEEVLSRASIDGEIYRPERLSDSMRYSALGGGKRLRPFLVLQCGALFGADRNNLLQVAAALECVHCYSLVHDDLPAMDDDDLRRGRATVHLAFDEQTAILAGDGLLTYAFDLLADDQAHQDAKVRIALISKLAKAAGIGGMVGGQMLDLQPENSNPALSEIARMQAMKTGALIKYACQAGGLCGKAAPDELSALGRYGEAIGQAFQLADDMLDITASEQQMGKGTAKDERQGKRTQISTLGLDAARQMADDLVIRACDELDLFGSRAEILKLAAQFIIRRSQ